jgi:hypothetical protein
MCDRLGAAIFRFGDHRFPVPINLSVSVTPKVFLYNSTTLNVDVYNIRQCCGSGMIYSGPDADPTYRDIPDPESDPTFYITGLRTRP